MILEFTSGEKWKVNQSLGNSLRSILCTKYWKWVGSKCSVLILNFLSVMAEEECLNYHLDTNNGNVYCKWDSMFLKSSRRSFLTIIVVDW